MRSIVTIMKHRLNWMKYIGFDGVSYQVNWINRAQSDSIKLCS